MQVCLLKIVFLSLLLSIFVLESEAGPKSKKGIKSSKSPKTTKSKSTKSPKPDEEDEIVVKYEGDGKDAIFNQISASEMESIVDYLKSEGIIHLNRNELESAHNVSNTNYAMVYQLFPPPKAEALEYLDGDGPMPARYATVTVNRGAARPRDVMVRKTVESMKALSLLLILLVLTLPLAIRFNRSTKWALLLTAQLTSAVL